MLRVLIGLAVLAFTIYTVVDVIQTEEERVQHLPKLVWLILALLFPVVGGAAWWLTGRPESIALLGSRPPRRPQGPDDDPDFLGRL